MLLSIALKFACDVKTFRYIILPVASVFYSTTWFLGHCQRIIHRSLPALAGFTENEPTTRECFVIFIALGYVCDRLMFFPNIFTVLAQHTVQGRSIFTRHAIIICYTCLANSAKQCVAYNGRLSL